ncbi:tRNA modification GTPase TrmE [Listeria monocytogenes]|nr:tRNA modification GTPase TrmE [Listeria monocytogenes]
MNSPGSAKLAPFRSNSCNTRFTETIPPCALISTTSSRVKVRGARITVTITSSITSPSSFI